MTVKYKWFSTNGLKPVSLLTHVQGKVTNPIPSMCQLTCWSKHQLTCGQQTTNTSADTPPIICRLTHLQCVGRITTNVSGQLTVNKNHMQCELLPVTF